MGLSRTMEHFKVRVSKDYLSFSAAHFIVFRGTQCERLHGHNYRVAAEVEGELDDDQLVFDFIALKQIMKELTDELDHRMLVPELSSKISIDPGEDSVRLAYEDREWVVPRGDCALLPLENTTAELLARYLAGRLRDKLSRRERLLLKSLRVDVDESPGQSAIYTLELPPGTTGRTPAAE